MTTDDPLASWEHVTAHDLTKGPLILPNRRGPQSILSSWFGRRFSKLNVAGTANLNEAADALVRAGMGRSLQVAPSHASDDLARIPLDPPLVTGSCLVWLKGKPMSRAAIAFADFAREQFAKEG